MLSPLLIATLGLLSPDPAVIAADGLAADSAVVQLPTGRPIIVLWVALTASPIDWTSFNDDAIVWQTVEPDAIAWSHVEYDPVAWASHQQTTIVARSTPSSPTITGWSKHQ